MLLALEESFIPHHNLGRTEGVRGLCGGRDPKQKLQPHVTVLMGLRLGPPQAPVPSRDQKISCSGGSWWLCQGTERDR